MRDRIRIALFSGVLWSAAWWGAAGALVQAHGNPLMEARLQQSGFRVQGPVTAIAGDRVSYEFLDFGGKKHTAEALVGDPNRVRALAKSGIVTVVYLPKEPEVSKLEGERYSTLESWILFTLAGVGFLSWPVVAWRFWKRRGQRPSPTAASSTTG